MANQIVFRDNATFLALLNRAKAEAWAEGYAAANDPQFQIEAGVNPYRKETESGIEDQGRA